MDSSKGKTPRAKQPLEPNSSLRATTFSQYSKGLLGQSGVLRQTLGESI